MDSSKAATPILTTLLASMARPDERSSEPLLEAFREALAKRAEPADVSGFEDSLLVFGEASAIFSDPERALEWLNTPSDVFAHQRPVAVMGSAEGRRAVREQLARIEHGIFY